MLTKNNFDFVIIGGGMVGLSIAYQLIENNKSNNICVIDKEIQLGMHSSGRNSGVVHAGIYYKPESLKAKVCIKGAKRLLAWTKSKKLPINKCGKIIIPQKEDLDKQIDLLFKRGRDNGAEVEIIKEDKIKEIAPSARSITGRAIWSPNTCVVSPSKIIKTLEDELSKKGVKFIKAVKSLNFDKKQKKVTLGDFSEISYGYLFNCAGLHADEVAHKFNVGNIYKIIPFKGQYWRLRSSSRVKPKCNIYPVPDLNVPFLGIHFTPGPELDSEVSIGPTANFSWGRENYYGFQSFELIESLKNIATITNQYLKNRNGFKKYVHEQALLNIKPLIVKTAKGLIPTLKSSDVIKSNKVGIRSQLFNLEKQKLEDDFICVNSENSTHVLNAVSPAFTASFELADKIIEHSLV